jgi:hypothetical protein
MRGLDVDQRSDGHLKALVNVTEQLQRNPSTVQLKTHKQTAPTEWLNKKKIWGSQLLEILLFFFKKRNHVHQCSFIQNIQWIVCFELDSFYDDRLVYNNEWTIL